MTRYSGLAGILAIFAASCGLLNGALAGDAPTAGTSGRTYANPVDVDYLTFFKAIPRVGE